MIVSDLENEMDEDEDEMSNVLVQRIEQQRKVVMAKVTSIGDDL